MMVTPRSASTLLLVALLLNALPPQLPAQPAGLSQLRAIVDVPAETGREAFALGDIDFDGVDDLLLGSQTGTTFGLPQVLTAISGGTGAVLWTRTDTVSYYGQIPFTLGDQDGDGILEVGVFATDGGTFPSSSPVWIDLLSGATGQRLQRVLTPCAGTGQFGSSRVGTIPDQNGDGVDDVCVTGNLVLPSGERPFLLDPMTGAVIRTATVASSPQVGPVAVGVDLTGDGVPEIAIGHARQGVGEVTMHDGATLNPIWSRSGLTPSGLFGSAIVWPSARNQLQPLLVSAPRSLDPAPQFEGRVYQLDARTGTIYGEIAAALSPVGLGQSMTRRAAHQFSNDPQNMIGAVVQASALVPQTEVPVLYGVRDVVMGGPASLERQFTAPSDRLIPGAPVLVAGRTLNQEGAVDLFAYLPGSGGSAGRLLRYARRSWRSFGEQGTPLGNALLQGYQAQFNNVGYGMNLSSGEAGPTPFLLVVAPARPLRQVTPFGDLFVDLTDPAAWFLTGTTQRYPGDPRYIANVSGSLATGQVYGEFIAQGAILDFETPGWVLLSNALRLGL